MKEKIEIYDDDLKDLAFDLTILALHSFNFGGECSFEDSQAFRKDAYELIRKELGLELK